MSDLGLATAWIPIAWISLNASKALLNIPGGKISDRFGRARTQVAGWFVYAAAYALFPMTRSVALTWLLVVAYGAYYGLTEGGEKALVADLAPPELRGRAYGALHLRGHDHHAAGEARRMEMAETRILRRLGLPNPWGQRAGRRT